FFFSSRRRHTRFSRDWSSDVCSSDLDTPVADDATIVQQMAGYARAEVAQGVPLRAIVKPMLGLFNGRKGARQWRRHLSDPAQLATQNPEILQQAFAFVT